MTTSKILFGDDYMLWIETATSGTFEIIDGQGSLTINRGRTKMNTSNKNRRGYNTSAFGNQDVSIDLDITPVLPDPGYSRLEASSNAQPAAPITIQVRKNGLNGASADAIFAASMYCSVGTNTFGMDAAGTAKGAFALADAPTVDTLA